MHPRAWSEVERFLIRVIRGDAAWPAGLAPSTVIDAASFHGVLPLLFHLAHGTPAWAGWPQPVQAALGDAARQRAAVELARRVELQRLLGLMHRAGVEAILLKGTPLAYSHYAQPALRERADTDLLIRPAHRVRLSGLLEAQGYRAAEAAGGELATSEQSYAADESPVALDVHWRIKNSPLLAQMFAFDELAARAVPIPELGRHARAPGPVDAVLLAAVHRATHHQAPVYADGIAHRGDRLIWLYDLHLLVPRLDSGPLEELAQRAAQHRVSGLCLDALRVTRDAFGTPLPPALWQALERAAARNEPSMAFLRGGRRQLLLAELRAVAGWGERARWLREHVLPPGDYMLRKYGTKRRWLLPALYLRRAVGWLAK